MLNDVKDIDDANTQENIPTIGPYPAWLNGGFHLLCVQRVLVSAI